MTFKTAVDNLAGTYEKYGFTREEIEELLKDGIMNQGFSVNVAYNGIRMALAHATGEQEYFSIEDMMEITGEAFVVSAPIKSSTSFLVTLPFSSVY